MVPVTGENLHGRSAEPDDFGSQGQASGESFPETRRDQIFSTPLIIIVFFPINPNDSEKFVQLYYQDSRNSQVFVASCVITFNI